MTDRPQTLAELVARVRGAPAPAPPQEQPTAPPNVPIPGGAVATISPAPPREDRGAALGISTATELIGGQEIASLAGKLARHKSENKQSIGRAMLRALRGEVWAPQGSRNATMYQIAAELVEAYPNLDPGSVVLAFSAAISNAELQGSKYTPEKLLSALERVQDERSNRLNMMASLGGLVETLAPGAPMPVWQAPPAPAGATPDPDAARAGELNAAGFDTLIIRACGDFYLRAPDRGTYDWKLTNALDLRVKMTNLFGRENGTVITHVDGEFVGVEKICEVYARVADRVIYDYTSPATTYDLGAATLRVGLPAAPPAAAPDERVHTWLRELAGGSDHDVSELYDWIASTTRTYIDRPAAALVIVGAKDAGKSVFARALAATWGVLPVKLANAVERFNGALLNSPFWHADERMPEEMTEACFRETVPERSRLVEPKGREKVELIGCGRLMFTLNSVDDLHVGSTKGADAIDAVAGRLALFDCSKRAHQIALAHDRLRLPLSFDLDLPAVVSHLRHVQDTHTPRPQRFLGARADASAARAIVINQSARYSDMYVDAICDYLSDPDTWEKAYTLNVSQYAIPGRAFPLVTKDGHLYAWPTEFAARVGSREPKALAVLLAGPERTLIRYGTVRGSYREIDLERIVALRPDIRAALVDTLSRDTKERLGIT